MRHSAGLIRSQERIRLIQNEVFGAVLIYETVNGFFRASLETKGLPLSIALLILPVIFDESFSFELASKKTSSALFRAVSENPNVKIGLQRKVENLAKLTFASIQVGLSSGILIYDMEAHEIRPGNAPGYQKIKKNIKQRSAAKKLGEGAFYMGGIEQLAALLDVRF